MALSLSGAPFGFGTLAALLARAGQARAPGCASFGASFGARLSSGCPQGVPKLQNCPVCSSLVASQQCQVCPAVPSLSPSLISHPLGVGISVSSPVWHGVREMPKLVGSVPPSFAGAGRASPGSATASGLKPIQFEENPCCSQSLEPILSCCRVGFVQYGDLTQDCPVGEGWARAGKVFRKGFCLALDVPLGFLVT